MLECQQNFNTNDVVESTGHAPKFRNFDLSLPLSFDLVVTITNIVQNILVTSKK